MSMILPEGVEKLKNEKESKANEKSENKIAEAKREIDPIETTSIVSNEASDVEYEEDYENDDKIDDDRFDDFQPMALKRNEQPLKYKQSEMRDFSIDLWNGSPGLSDWGYNESNHEG